ncbi:hypothetical protein ACS3SW_19215 [Roseobacteraceae bacterium S113]
MNDRTQGQKPGSKENLLKTAQDDTFAMLVVGGAMLVVEGAMLIVGEL